MVNNTSFSARKITNLEYARVGGKSLVLDLDLPEDGTKPKALVL
jgi:hypothetical protein